MSGKTKNEWTLALIGALLVCAIGGGIHLHRTAPAHGFATYLEGGR